MLNAKEIDVGQINFDDLISEVIEKKKQLEFNNSNVDKNGVFTDEYDKLIQLEKSLCELKNRFNNLENTNTLLDSKVLEINKRLTVIEKDFKETKTKKELGDKTNQKIRIFEKKENISNESSREGVDRTFEIPKNMRGGWLKVESDKDQNRTSLSEKLKYVNSKDEEIQNLKAQGIFQSIILGVQIFLGLSLPFLMSDIKEKAHSEIEQLTSTVLSNLLPSMGIIFMFLIVMLSFKLYLIFSEIRSRGNANKNKLKKLGYKDE